MNVLVLCATPQEFEPYLLLPGATVDTSYGITTLTYAAPNNTDTLLVANIGFGKVNAAFATTLLCQHSFDIIINAGLCGSLIPELKPGDVCYCAGYLEHDLDLTPLGEPRYQVISAPYCRIHDQLKCMVPELKDCIIATGDQFITKTDSLEFTAAICDMEYSAIARTVARFGCMTFFGLKMVSDSGNSEEYVNNASLLCRKLAELVLGIIDQFCLCRFNDSKPYNLVSVTNQK